MKAREAPDRLERAGRRVRALRRFFVAAVILRGLLVLVATLAVVMDAALLAAYFLPSGQPVLQIAKAGLSFLSAVIAVYVIVMPLHRSFSMPRFVRYLDKKLGRESYILTAWELNQGKACNNCSKMLAEQVGALASLDLDSLGMRRFSVVSSLPLVVCVAAVIGSMTLAASMAFPEGMQGAMMKLFVVDSRPEQLPMRPQAGRQRAESPRPKEVPPCSHVSVEVQAPSYLTNTHRMDLKWGQRGQVVAGAGVTVRCESRVPGQQLVLERHQHSGVEHVAFQPDVAQRDRSGWMSARTRLMENTVLFIQDLSTGRGQPERLEFVVVPDVKPACALHQPAGEIILGPQDTLSILAEAADDLGLSSVAVVFRVDGLDESSSTIELSRPSGENRVLVQRDIPVTTFGADPGDRIRFLVQVEDANNVTGPGRCRTDEAVLVLASPYAEQRDVIEKLARARDASVDRLGEALTIRLDRPTMAEALPEFEQKVEQYAQTLTDQGRRMSSIRLFKAEDARRVSALAASVDEWLHVEKPESMTENAVVDRLVAAREEFRQHVVVLDGLVEKLLGEYLFFESGRMQQELSRLLVMSREDGSDPSVSRSIRRSLKKLRRSASRTAGFEHGILPAMPTLFSSSLARETEGGFAGVAAVSGRLLEGGNMDDWKVGMDRLSLALESAARSVEGAYAKSMNRISSSFRTAREQLTGKLADSIALSRALKTELETLLGDVEQETRKYIKGRRTIRTVQEIARKIKHISRKSRRFKSHVYLPVDRKQVKEFKERLADLSRRVALLQLDDATRLAQELGNLTSSMEFSLKLTIQYSEDKRMVRKSRDELENVREVRDMVQSVAARLQAIRPQRERLESLEPVRLEGLGASLDELAANIADLRRQVDELEKMFPIFFARFVPALDRLADTVSQARASLNSLLLDETHRRVLFAEESMVQLQDMLQYASGQSKGAGTLGVGGLQPGLQLEGKGELVSRDRLDRLLKLSAPYWGNDRWAEITKQYYKLLSQ